LTKRGKVYQELRKKKGGSRPGHSTSAYRRRGKTLPGESNHFGYLEEKSTKEGEYPRGRKRGEIRVSEGGEQEKGIFGTKKEKKLSRDKPPLRKRATRGVAYPGIEGKSIRRRNQDPADKKGGALKKEGGSWE